MNQPPPPGTRIVQEVDPRGSALLDMLVELGHVEEPLLGRINDILLDTPGENGRLGFEDVRRAAATVLFEHLEELEPEHRRVLLAEWPLLFY